MTDLVPVEAIPPTPLVRERLGRLIRESDLTRRLLRLAEQRDRISPELAKTACPSKEEGHNDG